MKRRHKNKEFLELDEFKEFFDIAKKHGLYMDYLIFVTLAYTGMRIGELLSLNWSDLDLVNNTLSITKTYYNPNNYQIVYKLLQPKIKK